MCSSLAIYDASLVLTIAATSVLIATVGLMLMFHTSGNVEARAQFKKIMRKACKCFYDPETTEDAESVKQPVVK